MKNSKGQALVEFVIILPIVILLVFCIVDFARVISLKNDLENVVSDAVTLYENGSTKEEIQDLFGNRKDKITINFDQDDKYITISANKKIESITPGLTHIAEKIFNVSASRVIKNE